MIKFSQCLPALVTSGLILLAPVTTSAATYVKAQTSSAGGTPHIILTTVGSIVQRHDPDLRIQISAGKSFPQLTADLVNKRSDFVTTSPIVTHYMRNQSHMYSKMRDAKKKSESIRYILAFPLGSYHWVVRPESGIREIADLRGKRIFAGPRAAGAAAMAVDTIRAETGMEPGKDYEYVSLDWASGVQAFQDKQIDIYIRPGNVPMAPIQEFAMTGKIDLLSIKQSTIESESLIKSQLSAPGRRVGEISPGVYGPSQINASAVTVVDSYSALASRADYDADAIYRITKAVWENLGELHAAAPWLKQIEKSKAFTEMNAPLHLGAYRYYKEAGFEIPADLVPPELK